MTDCAHNGKSKFIDCATELLAARKEVMRLRTENAELRAAKIISFNVNNYVRVRLTQLGRDIHRSNYDKLFQGASFTPAYTPPKVDAEGWSKWQMHDLMNQFGHALYIGFAIPFETVIQIELEAQ